MTDEDRDGLKVVILAGHLRSFTSRSTGQGEHNRINETPTWIAGVGLYKRRGVEKMIDEINAWRRPGVSLQRCELDHEASVRIQIKGSVQCFPGTGTIDELGKQHRLTSGRHDMLCHHGP